MIQDLHNHTYMSYDGVETPDTLIDNAIRSGIDIIGITDHQFTDSFDFDTYIKTLQLAKKRYKDKCSVKIGLEIGTRPKPDNFLAKTSSGLLDYCLFESLDSERGMDLYEFLEWRKLFSCPTGLAHTDIFALSERYGVDIFKILRENDIFWEINISGNYSYYYDFLSNPKKRKAVSESGITISIGSDTHRIYEFNKSKLISANELAETLGNRIIFVKGW
ncbi:MAG: PHP domain-containing protein [Eubacteriales bacterium]|nr:PHP domain-containing protein [Eubacteriales bacterium]